MLFPVPNGPLGKQLSVRSGDTVTGSEVTAAIRRASAPVPGPTSGAGVTWPVGAGALDEADVLVGALLPLVAAGLAAGEKVGKEVFYSPSASGEAAVQKYRAVREACLVANLDAERNADIGELARLMRTMSGLYDQAARAATSL